LRELQTKGNDGDFEKKVQPVTTTDAIVAVTFTEPEQDIDAEPDIPADSMALDTVVKRTSEAFSQLDSPDVPARFSEKKRLNWAGKCCEYRL
jgi:hypothetical protein